MIIKKANKTQFESVYQILYKNALWLQTKSAQQWPLDWLENKKQSILESITVGEFYVGLIDRQLSCVMQLTLKADFFWNDENTVALYVHKLAVDRTYKNKGLGKKMLNEVEKIAKQQGIKTVRLDCVKANPFLKQYYTDSGFIQVGEADDEGETVLLFEKTVNKSIK
ncbi:MAG: GNAT family N-acetyltransferase [Saccharospirillaceae bacterium]|nr:GNAT family N-acetyltransferase [Pseudomonadales bacterium]NRB81509.1 GNAT family N-acetyltransferase [Saccharospirillaceae bacterium]